MEQDLVLAQKVEGMIAYGYGAVRHFPKSERHVLSQELRLSMWRLMRLVIDGTPIDLSGDWVKLEPDTEGEPLEPSGNLLAGERDPETGEITLTVRAPHGPNAPESERFPKPVTLADGESVEFPR